MSDWKDALLERCGAFPFENWADELQPRFYELSTEFNLQRELRSFFCLLKNSSQKQPYFIFEDRNTKTTDYFFKENKRKLVHKLETNPNCITCPNR